MIDRRAHDKQTVPKTKSKKIRSADSEFKYLTLFEQSPFGVLLIDTSGNILEFNRAAHQQLGYTKKEFAELRISDIDPAKSWVDIEKSIQKTLKAGQAEFEVKHRAKNGQIRDVQVITQVLALSGRAVFHTIWRDITERKMADAGLKQISLKLETLVNAIPDIVILKDAKGKCLLANRAVEEHTGLTLEELKGKSNYDMLPADLADLCTQSDVKAIFQGAPVHSEERSLNRDGSTLILDTIKAPVYDHSGRLEGLVCISRDITARKRAEQRLLKETERSRVLLDLYHNASSLTEKELYGYVLDQVVKLTGSTIGFFHQVSEDQNTIMPAVWNCEAQKNCSYPYGGGHYPISQAGNWVDCVRLGKPVVYNDYQISTTRKGLPEGHVQVKRFMSMPIFEDGKIRYIFGVGNKESDYEEADINHLQIVANELQEIISKRRSDEALKQSEAALRRSEDKFRTLFESASDPLLIIDTVGNIKEVNRAAHELLGYEKEEMKAMNLSGLVHPEFRGLIRDRIGFIKKHGWNRFESAYLKKDGSAVPIEVNTGIIELEGSENFFSMARDITERKQAEKLIRDALNEKETLLRELYHRVKNNMQVISSMINIRASSCNDGRDPGIFDDIQNRIRAMSLVHEKLYASGDLASVDIKSYLEELANGLLDGYKKNRGNVSIAMEIESIPLSIDAITPCGLILNELMSNSLKYAFPGELPGVITIRFHSAGEDRMEFVYLDNGIGLGDGIAGNKKTLGLRLVRNLVEKQLAGRLEVKGGGDAEFRINFKRAAYRFKQA